MTPDEKARLEDTYRLVRENNKMLRGMRRMSFLSGLFRIALWVGLLIVSWWVYQEYLAPIVDSMLATMEQLQGTSAQAQAQFGALQEAMNKLKQLGF